MQGGKSNLPGIGIYAKLGTGILPSNSPGKNLTEGRGMRHFLPIGQIALLSLLVATGSVGGVIAQGRSSQQGAKGITASPSPRTSDPCSSHEASTGSAGTGNALSIEVE